MTTMLANTSGPVFFAHQGGWDEIAMIGVPVLVIAALLVLAKRRVDALTDDDAKAAERNG